MTSPLGEAAVDYVRRGWAVFPVEPEGKKPAGQLVPHGLKQATADEAEVLRWWKREPAANIGLRTGLTFDALDVDGPDGMAALEQLCAGRQTIDGPTCKTGGGGDHVYVQATGLGNKAGLLPKVDWRGNGGYVVAPPSMHASGKRYEWIEGWGPDEQAPGPIPAWLRDLLEPPPSVAAALGGSHERLTTNGDAYGRRALESEIARVLVAPEGHRNHQLNVSAFAVGSLIAGGAISDSVGAIEMLHTAGVRCGLTEAECLATIRSGIDSGSCQPRSAPARQAG